MQKLGPYSAECYWHYLYKSPPPAKCCWFPPAMAAARTAPDAAAAVAAASAVVEGIEEGRKRTRGAIQARKEAALRAEGERKKEARLAAASAEVARRKADAVAGLPEHEQLQSAALKEEEEAAMAAAQANAASAAVWRRKQARALLFARPVPFSAPDHRRTLLVVPVDWQLSARRTSGATRRSSALQTSCKGR